MPSEVDCHLTSPAGLSAASASSRAFGNRPRGGRPGRAVLVGCAFALAAVFLSCSKPAASPKSAGDEPRPVRTAAAVVRPMERLITVSGSLAAREQATLSAKVPGRLESIRVDIGSTVKKNEVIAQVERRDYELRLRQATAAVSEARASVGLPLAGDEEEVSVEAIASVQEAKAVLDEAVKNRERMKQLSQEGISSKSQVDTAETAYSVAFNRYQVALEEGRTKVAVLAQRHAELEVARQQLEDASIRAPFDGAVQLRLANTGEFLAVGRPIVSLVRLDPLRLRLEVPERESLLVRSGQSVRVLPEGGSNHYAGHIARISPAITEENRMLLVEADVPNRGELRAGLFVRAHIVVDAKDAALAVPAAALITFAGLEKVVTIEDGKARERSVVTGRRDGEWVEITTGLRPGEAVVISPGGLRTGQAVTVAPEEPGVLTTRAEHSGP